MVAGLVLGPWVLRFYDRQAVADLEFLNSLALAFIAFCAGGELRLSHIREKLKSISFLLSGITLVVFIGVTLTVFAFSPFIPFMKGYPLSVRLAISAIFGVISTARSPSSAMAIISETKAKGPFTDTVLAVTVAMDVVVIVLFAVVISICQILIEPGSELSLMIVPHLLLEIAIAFVLGHLFGRGVIFLAQRAGVELPIIIAGMGFLVIKFCHTLSSEIELAYDISLNLEPLLICMAAGFTVQNFSDHGDRFLHSMDRVSLPIYVGFFAITGASIQLDVLEAGWLLGLMVVVARLVMLNVGSRLSARAAGDPPLVYKNAWLGFVTQAGVSLGLLAEVVRRFPEVGVHVQTILIATITVNQVIGPVAFKYVLDKVGESREQPPLPGGG
jgi:Kef-type K+ transport system membrane component KefB